MQDLYENLLLSVDTAFLFQIKFYLSIYHLKLRNLRKCKPKDFLRIINSYSDSKSNDIPVSADRLFFHFKHLNKPNSHSSGSTPQTSDVITNETIDFPITEEEVANSNRLLKPSKSPGIDNIPPRVYKVLNQLFITSNTQLFNKILETGQFPSQWGIGVICRFERFV